MVNKLLLILILSFSCYSQTYTVFGRVANCQSHWVFDSTYAAYKGKYVLYDYSGNGNDIAFASSGDGYSSKLTADAAFIPSGLVVDPVPANFDRFILSGSDADFADVNGSGSLTIVGRHKWQGATIQFLANRLNTSTGSVGWLLEQRSGGVFRFYFSDGTDVFNGGAVSMGFANNESATWAVVLDRTNKTVRFYSGGDSVNVYDWSATDVNDMTTAAPFVVNNNSALSGAYLDNYFYELQIYNVALTSAQISAIMSNQEVVNATRRKKYSGFNGRNKY